jgi:transcriptional regulator with XRE-family HTH domain
MLKTQIALIGKLKKFRKHYGLSQESVAQYIEASWPSVSRWERGEAKPVAAMEARLSRVIRLGEALKGVIHPDSLDSFLTSPHPLLRNLPPVDLLQSEYSFRDLMEFVEAAKSGSMA